MVISRCRRWLDRFSVALLALVWMAVASAEADGVDEDAARAVPPVSERIEVLDRHFEIDRITLDGVVDRPEHGLTRGQLDAFVASLLDEITHRPEIQRRGYSESEVDRILAKITEIQNRDRDTNLVRLRLMNGLIRELESIMANRGLNLSQMEEIARAVEQRYRQAGYLFARVIIPAQEITSGELHLKVLEGTLGEVTVERNQIHSDAVVAAALDALKGRPIHKDELDEALRIVNDKDSLNAFGQFLPGDVGETDIAVLVSDERRWSGGLSLDNHGSRTTGRTRATGLANLYNLTGHGDTLSLTGLRSEGPNAVTVGSLAYRLPLPNPRHTLAASADFNEFAVGFSGDVKVETDTTRYQTDYEWVVRRTQDLGVDFTASAAYKDSRLDVLVAGTPLSSAGTDQQIATGTLGVRYNSLLRRYNTIIEGTTSVTAGALLDGAQRASTSNLSGQEEDFYIFNHDLQSFSIFDWSLAGTRVRQAALLRMSVQYAEQFLPSVEQYAMGGAQRVRGYLTDDISVDSGTYVGAQLYTFLPASFGPTLPWLGQTLSDVIKPFVFADYAYGVRRAQNINRSTVQDEWVELASYGIGFDYYLFQDVANNYDVRGTITVGFPASARFSNPDLDGVQDDGVQIFANISLELDQDRLNRMGVSRAFGWITPDCRRVSATRVRCGGAPAP